MWNKVDYTDLHLCILSKALLVVSTLFYNLRVKLKDQIWEKRQVSCHTTYICMEYKLWILFWIFLFCYMQVWKTGITGLLYLTELTLVSIYIFGVHCTLLWPQLEIKVHKSYKISSWFESTYIINNVFLLFFFTIFWLLRYSK